jgi:prolyl-tRNA synthetase
MAPFQVALLPINARKSQRLREATEQIYQKLLNSGIDVLLDDREVRPGVMFADMELIGIPHRLVLSERGMDDGQLEYKGRRDQESILLPWEQGLTFLQERLASPAEAA